jgi:hypothetical protein
VRGKIAEVDVERKALIKAITDFIKTVLSVTTLTQKLATPKRKSVELGTQNGLPPTRSVKLPSTSSMRDDVYEQTSPVSTRFAGTPAAAVNSDVDDDDGKTRAINKGNVHAFARM